MPWGSGRTDLRYEGRTSDRICDKTVRGWYLSWGALLTTPSGLIYRLWGHQLGLGPCTKSLGVNKATTPLIRPIPTGPWKDLLYLRLGQKPS